MVSLTPKLFTNNVFWFLFHNYRIVSVSRNPCLGQIRETIRNVSALKKFWSALINLSQEGMQRAQMWAVCVFFALRVKLIGTVPRRWYQLVVGSLVRILPMLLISMSV